MIQIIKDIIGKTYKNNAGLEFIVLSFEYHINTEYYFKIKFIQSESEKIVNHRNIKSGGIKDYFNPSKYDVGYLGNSDGKIYGGKAYKKWDAMLSRCYNTKNNMYHNYGSKGVKVCGRWRCFENFVCDLPKLQGWDEEKFINGELELDKDKLFEGNKIYSLETCCLISKKENMDIMNKTKQHDFIAISPEGIEYTHSSQVAFAKMFNLTARSIGICLHNQLNHHKGWKFKYI